MLAVIQQASARAGRANKRADAVEISQEQWCDLASAKLSAGKFNFPMVTSRIRFLE
jgi:hypothetical protein